MRATMPMKDVDEFFARLSATDPEPRGELNYVNDFTLTVAVVLSAQATDAGVNKATKNLFKTADTPEKMLSLGEAQVREHIKSIGLYRNKAKNIIALSEMLIADFSGKIPRTRDELTKLPGVGRKTANVVLNIAFGQPTMAVDTHIFRLGNRTGMAPGKNVVQVEDKLIKRIPPQWMQNAHHWLILHGRYICKARKPECWNCIVWDLCRFKGKSEK
ncbi:MAG: Endonuclease III [Alphaproteobacteria bacterium MarineAlpha11_Bin1]|nr:MAG: Endonuclease III [Alphaproteobacteria bacterium MarineAlpha11_Bin1]|tara:strand:+ start:15871 stop:16518 length:648 start_codon:yes stop_codon:yes gene_type:complete